MPESTRGKNYLLLSKQHSKEHPDNVILFSDKIYVCVCVCVCVCVWALKSWKDMEEAGMHTAKWSNLSEKAIYHMNPTICHSGKGKTMKTVQKSVVAGSWERDEEVEQEGSEIILHDTVMVHICHYTFVNSHRIYNPSTNYEFTLVIMHQCRFVHQF